MSDSEHECFVDDCSYSASKLGRTRHLNSHDDDVVKGVYIDELQRLADKLDQTPTSNDMNDQGEFSKRPYLDQFGSWNEALEAAGFEPNRRKNSSDEELLETLQELHEELNRPPLGDDVTNHTSFSTSTYGHRFGGLGNARKKAGVPSPGYPHVDEDELLEHLNQLYAELDRPPKYDEAREIGKFGPHVYEREFGSWNAALEEAGLELNRRRNVPREELIEGLQDLAKKLGHTPSAKEMREKGDYDWKSYRRVFGSWNEGVITAGFEPWEPPTGEESPFWVDGHDSCYGPNWHEKREEAIQRDGEACALQRCTTSREDHIKKYDRDLSVHHIERKENFRRGDGSLDYESANQLSNLITLCSPHHQQYEDFPIDIRHIEFAD